MLGAYTMSNGEAKVKEPMETWAKVFIALSVIIILGANIAVSAIVAYNGVQFSKKPSDPCHIDAVYEEISYVTDNNGDTYAIGVDYYEKVDTNTQEKNEFLDDAETVATAVGAVELLLFIPNVLAIVLSVNLYKAIKKNRNGEKATANIIGVIVCAGILVGGGIFAAVAIESYVEKAQEAHQSVAVHAPVIYLYTEEETDLRASGVKQFDYVNPANREVQIEMEQACTAHLRQVGALVDTSQYQPVDFAEQDFEVEASVIIPVFNREKTIRDAVESALSQKTNFKYNVIVVDNHSTDGTGEILSQLSTLNSQLVVLVPERHDLGIGGCWNEAINSIYCGRFAVQLDSDDLYSSPKTLQTIVDAFHKQDIAFLEFEGVAQILALTRFEVIGGHGNFLAGEQVGHILVELFQIKGIK